MTRFMPQPDRRGKRQAKLNALTFAKLTRALMEGDMTLAELAEETGLHYVSVLRYCRTLRAEGAIYIADWRPDKRGTPIMKVYKIGTRPDAPKPVKTKAAIGRDYRKRKAMREMIQLTAGRAA